MLREIGREDNPQLSRSPSDHPRAALNRRFGENLILLRSRVGLSQEGTAQRAGPHKTQLSLLERGLRSPRLDTIVKLGGAVEAEPCELLAGMAWRLRVSLERPGAYAQEIERSVGG